MPYSVNGRGESEIGKKVTKCDIERRIKDVIL